MWVVKTPYDYGIEINEDVHGYSVFSHADGDDPQLVAFFVSENDLRAFLTLRNADGEDIVFDPCSCIAAAVVTSANDFAIETHEQLRELAEKYAEQASARGAP